MGSKGDNAMFFRFLGRAIERDLECRRSEDAAFTDALRGLVSAGLRGQGRSAWAVAVALCWSRSAHALGWSGFGFVPPSDLADMYLGEAG